MFKQKEKNKKRGFTLIELMVVVGVLAVLSGVLLNLLNVGGLRSKARDSNRISDLKRLQTALELYFSENRKYPLDVAGNANVWQALSVYNGTLSPNFINVVPLDPLNGSPVSGATCFGKNNYGYYYISNAAQSRYALGAIMETATAAGANTCETLYVCGLDVASGGVTCNCGGGSADRCLGFENPL